MAYVILKKDGKKINFPFVLTEREVENLERNDPDHSYVLVNTATRRTRKIGKHGRRKAKHRVK